MQKLRKRRRTVFAEVNIGGRDACANRNVGDGNFRPAEARMPNGRNAERAECRIIAVSNKTDEKLY